MVRWCSVVWWLLVVSLAATARAGTVPVPQGRANLILTRDASDAIIAATVEPFSTTSASDLDRAMLEALGRILASDPTLTPPFRLTNDDLSAAITAGLEKNGFVNLSTIQAPTVWTIKARRNATTSAAAVRVEMVGPDSGPVTTVGPSAPPAEPPERISKRVAAERSSGLATNPQSCTQLWSHSRYRVSLPGAPAGGQVVPAQPRLEALAVEILALACLSYADDQGLTVITTIKKGIPKLVTDRLGSDYWDGSSGSDCAFENGTLVVRVKPCRPTSSVSARVTQISLPVDKDAKKGGPMTMEQFDAKYGNMEFGRALHRAIQAQEKIWQTALEGLFPAASLPDFISAAQRKTALDLLQNDKALRKGLGWVSCTDDPNTGALSFSILYIPPQGDLALTVTNNTDHETTAALSFGYTWDHVGTLAVSGSYSSEAQSAATSFTFAKEPIGTGGWSRTEVIAGDYARDRAVRLGTQADQLVTVEEWAPRTGLTLDYDSGNIPQRGKGEWARHWAYRAELGGSYRSLAARGPAAILRPPTLLRGTELSICQTLEYRLSRRPAEDAKDFKARLKQRRSPAVWVGALRVDAKEWWPDRLDPYLRLRTDAYFRAQSGPGGMSDRYFEVRGTHGYAGASTPRLDFYRLGGQDVIFGLDQGELAGRSFWAVAMEHGWSVASIIRRFSRDAKPVAPQTKEEESQEGPTQLDQFFIFLLAERGGVSRQTGAGADFASDTHATSLAAGARLLGGMPGSTKDASVSFGYAWSPQSTHRHGRFFVSISIFFHP